MESVCQWCTQMLNSPSLVMWIGIHLAVSAGIRYLRICWHDVQSERQDLHCLCISLQSQTITELLQSQLPENIQTTAVNVLCAQRPLWHHHRALFEELYRSDVLLVHHLHDSCSPWVERQSSCGGLVRTFAFPSVCSWNCSDLVDIVPNFRTLCTSAYLVWPTSYFMPSTLSVQWNSDVQIAVAAPKKQIINHSGPALTPIHLSVTSCLMSSLCQNLAFVVRCIRVSHLTTHKLTKLVEGRMMM